MGARRRASGLESYANHRRLGVGVCALCKSNEADGRATVVLPLESFLDGSAHVGIDPPRHGSARRKHPANGNVPCGREIAPLTRSRRDECTLSRRIHRRTRLRGSAGTSCDGRCEKARDQQARDARRASANSKGTKRGATHGQGVSAGCTPRKPVRNGLSARNVTARKGRSARAPPIATIASGLSAFCSLPPGSARRTVASASAAAVTPRRRRAPERPVSSRPLAC